MTGGSSFVGSHLVRRLLDHYASWRARRRHRG
ncbi:hypothetical protein ACH41H_35125 [Streptomyces sp. NPDC020800]